MLLGGGGCTSPRAESPMLQPRSPGPGTPLASGLRSPGPGTPLASGRTSSPLMRPLSPGPQAVVAVKQMSKDEAFARGWQMFHDTQRRHNEAIGIYTVVQDVAVETCLAPGNKSEDIICLLRVGTIVNVLAVAHIERRVRGRIEHPAGWISLLDLEDGYRWVQKQEVPKHDALVW